MSIEFIAISKKKTRPSNWYIYINEKANFMNLK